MASVEKRDRDGRVTWLCRWRDPTGFQRKKAFAKKADAARFAATVEATKATGSYVDFSDPTTVTEFAWQWAQSRPHRPTTAQRTASLIEHHIAPTRLGGRRLVEVPAIGGPGVGDRPGQVARSLDAPGAGRPAP